MFIYKLSSWVDKYDPYWYGRLMGLKIAYLTIGLFIANLFLQPPMAVLMIILSAAGIVIAEMPAINDLDKKDNLYLGYVIIICLSVGLVSTYAYFRDGFILAVCGWAYLLYFALRKKPELFSLVSSILMLSMLSIEGLNTGNFFSLLNTLQFIIEFSFITFWLHKLFPKLYHKIWLSSTLRTLETMQQMLLQHKKEESRLLFKHLMVANSSLNLLKKKPYSNLAQKVTEQLNIYHYYILGLLADSKTISTNLVVIADDLNQLLNAIRHEEELKAIALPESVDSLLPHYKMYPALNNNWNKLCVLVNS